MSSQIKSDQIRSDLHIGVEAMRQQQLYDLAPTRARAEPWGASLAEKLCHSGSEP